MSEGGRRRRGGGATCALLFSLRTFLSFVASLKFQSCYYYWPLRLSFASVLSTCESSLDRGSFSLWCFLCSDRTLDEYLHPC